MNRVKLLKILELDGNPTQNDIERAYKELIKVWHPDRFQKDPILREKAEERTRQINMAFQQLSENFLSVEESDEEPQSVKTNSEIEVPKVAKVNFKFIALFVVIFAISFQYFKGYGIEFETLNSGSQEDFLALKKEVLGSAKRNGEIRFEDGTKTIKSPFIKAITDCDQAKVESMLNAGSSVNEKDSYGNSALAWAVRQGCKNIVQSLLSKGASVNQKSNNGFSPLMWASLYNREEIQKILVDAGSEPLPKYWDRDY